MAMIHRRLFSPMRPRLGECLQSPVRQRGALAAMRWLQGFDGTLQVPSHGLQANHCRAMDGYTGYDALAEPKAGGQRAFDPGLLLGPRMAQTA